MSEPNAYLDKKVVEFVHKYGIACGGNWGAMYMWAIKNGMPDVYDAMENRNYSALELHGIIEAELKDRKEVI